MMTKFIRTLTQQQFKQHQRQLSESSTVRLILRRSLQIAEALDQTVIAVQLGAQLL